MLASLLPTMAAQPALAADTTVLTYAGLDTDRCTKRGPAVACPPAARPAPANNAVTAGDGFNVRFDAAVVPTAYRTSNQQHPFGYQGVMFTVRGFLDSPLDCYYSYSRSHLTTGRPYPLPSGLTVFAEATSNQVIGRVDGDLIYPESKDVQVSTSGKAGKYYCAITGIAVEYQQLPGSNLTPSDVDHVLSSPLRVAIQPPPAAGTVTASTPEIIAKSVGVPFTYRSAYTIVADVGGDKTNSRIASRLLFIGTADAEGAPCTGTVDSSRFYRNITSSGTKPYFWDMTVFMRSDVGRWLCTYQQVLNANGEESTSVPAYKKIEEPSAAVPEVNVPAVNVTDVLSRLSSSAAALRTALRQPQVNQAEVDRLIAEAEAARQAAEEALRNGGINNNGGGGNAVGGGNGGGANPGVPEIVEEIDRVDELIDRGKGNETPRSALELATGFDATVTPLLPVGSRTASGLELSVKSPKKVKRARSLTVTAKVDPGNVRGRLRMYLLRFDGDTPVVIRKRSGFISAARRSKKFYINRGDRLGKYAILTSFEPTTPGQVGVATLTPLRVVK